MDYFRWILLLAGLLLIAYMFFSGRRGNKESNYINTKGQETDPLFSDQRIHRNLDSSNGDSLEPSSQADYHDVFASKEDVQDIKLDDDMEFFTPLDDMTPITPISSPPKLLTSITEKIEAFSAKLTPKRKARMDASAARAKVGADSQVNEEKIISLSVTASEGEFLDGAEMYAIFSQRGYDFGEMGIFHSRYKGKSIFSVANMLEPGSFDLSTIETLQTPGITLFLQLPGPIAADVLFEVLVSEASDIARALGASVRDNRRSNLTKQTIQHMREDIYQYMHRVKYFNTRVH